MTWLHWADNCTEQTFGDEASAVKDFGTELQQLLHDRTQGRVREDVRLAGVGNGLEAHRVLKHRYGRRIAATKRTVFNKILSVEFASRVDEVEDRIRHFEDVLSRREGLSWVPLAEDSKVTLLIEALSRTPRLHRLEEQGPRLQERTGGDHELR